ncbi:MAG: CAP domain-containing protein, partial [Candidatus Peribacteraceae bacterium]|nr:CAP domain-containing protein [Candidatus Peribacteraceae bacterium]
NILICLEIWYNTQIMLPIRLSLLSALILLFIAPLAHAQKSTEYVTRAEAVTFILRNRNPALPEMENSEQYPDIIENEWYSKFVLAGIYMGMWEPDENSNRVRPLGLVSRGEYLRMLTIAFNLPKDIAFPYTDVHQDNPYIEYAGTAFQNNLFYDETDPLRLRTDLPITHKEASDTYYTLLKKKPELRQSTYSITRKKKTDNSEIKNQNVLETFITIISRAFVKNALQKHVQNQQSYAQNIQEQVIKAVNKERRSQGIPPLSLNLTLQTAAVRHAKDMSERGYFSHFTPEGLSYVERIKASGYTDVNPIACGCHQIFSLQSGQSYPKSSGPNFVVYEEDVCSCNPQYALGENIAKGQMTAEEVVKDWMDSPGHKRNILEPSFKEMGLGIFKDIWVQNFGKFEVAY